MNSSIIQNYFIKRFWSSFFKTLFICLLLIVFFSILKFLVNGRDIDVFIFMLLNLSALTELLPYITCLGSFYYIRLLHKRNELHLLSLLGTPCHFHFKLICSTLLPICLYLFVYQGVVKPEIKATIENSKINFFKTWLDKGRFDFPYHIDKGYFWASSKDQNILVNPTIVSIKDNQSSLLQSERAHITKDVLLFKEGLSTSDSSHLDPVLYFKEGFIDYPKGEVKFSIKTVSIFDLFNHKNGVIEFNRRLQVVLSPIVLMLFGLSCAFYSVVGKRNSLVYLFVVLFVVYTPILLNQKSFRGDLNINNFVMIWLGCLVLFFASLLLLKIHRRGSGI